MRDKRLFVAIEMPPSVTDLLIGLNPELPGVRWLPAELIHLTVSFLGNVGPIAEETLLEKLSAIRFQPFFMPVKGIGTFPQKGKPNVVWAGVGAGHPQLFHVYKRVQEAALAAGLHPDLRSFHPHITFARCRDISAETIRPFLKRHADFDAGMIRVESFTLFSSIPGPLGSAYTRELEVRGSNE
jgi:2'-5' RNA ligase